MKRTPIVLGGTVAGIVGILAYHIPTTTGAAQTTASTATSAGGATSAASSSSTTAPASSTTTQRSATSSTTSAKRSATGQDVDYQYGDLELKVTKSGSRITGVSVERLDVNDPRSQSIDEEAIPDLIQQTLSAQSVKIDGVSGASYTSQAYEQSLQSALDKLA